MKLMTKKKIICAIFDSLVMDKKLLHYEDNRYMVQNRYGADKIYILSTDSDKVLEHTIFVHHDDGMANLIPLFLRPEEAVEVVNKYWHLRIKDYAFCGS